MPIISGGGGGGAISGVTITGTATAGQVPIATNGTAGTWGTPPGTELLYGQITAPANITDTSEATGTALISPGAFTFDGTAVYAEFYCAAVACDTNNVADITIISLFEGASQITRFAVIRALNTTNANVTPVLARYKFTPTAAAHTYILTAMSTSAAGTPKINAGTGGTGGYPPAYLRFVKA